MNKLAIFSGNANCRLAEDICAYLNISLKNALVSRFSEGEVQVKINENVRGLDVFVIQSICPPPNDSLMELLILIDALKRASAKRITAVLPYRLFRLVMVVWPHPERHGCLQCQTFHANSIR